MLCFCSDSCWSQAVVSGEGLLWHSEWEICSDELCSDLRAARRSAGQSNLKSPYRNRPVRKRLYIYNSCSSVSVKGLRLRPDHFLWRPEELYSNRGRQLQTLLSVRRQQRGSGQKQTHPLDTVNVCWSYTFIGDIISFEQGFHCCVCVQFGAETQQSKVAPSSAATRPIHVREQVTHWSREPRGL